MKGLVIKDFYALHVYRKSLFLLLGIGIIASLFDVMGPETILYILMGYHLPAKWDILASMKAANGIAMLLRFLFRSARL